MKTPVQWFGRGISLGMMAVILSACGQAPTTSGGEAQQATTIPATADSLKAIAPANSKSPAPTTQPQKVAQAPAIATFQTQTRKTGFSANGQHFMHLESWRDTGAGIPNAAMQVVNLATNTCVADGCQRTQFTESQANQSIAAAENELLNQTQQLRQDLNLTSPVAGVALPVETRSRSADGTESITVRLQNNQPLQLTLKQKKVVSVMDGGTAEKDQAAMQIEMTYGGQTRSLGSLTKMHDWILEFSIREVQQSPDGKTLAILVTGAERSFEGTLGRTIVQGFRL